MPSWDDSWAPDGSEWSIGSRGMDWVLFVPKGDNTAAQVRGKLQKVPDVLSKGSRTSFHWETIEQDGEELTIAVTVVMDDTEATRRLTLTLENRSNATVDSALFPAIDGFEIPAGRPLYALTRDYYGATIRGLSPRFEWTKGYYGTEYPTMQTETLVFGNPTAPFVVMNDGVESMSASIDGTPGHLTSWMWQLIPGYADTVGDLAHSASHASHLRFSPMHLANCGPGGTWNSAAVELHQSRGGWEGALELARKRHTRLSNTRLPEWAAAPHSWYQVEMSTSAGERAFTFADLPGLAQDCVDADVRVMHVIGWNAGGQDANNPSHDPDPALGGAEGLRKAIAECHEIGVKVILFAKFTWADQSTQDFRNTLVRHAVLDPYGDPYRGPAYQYLTPHQWMDVSPRRLVPMCFLDSDYLSRCECEFDKILDSGADGMLFDEAMHHSPALQCYSSSHGHAAGASVYAGDRLLARRLRARVPDGRQFLFAGETLYEDLQSDYQISYIRSHYVDHVPLTRFLNPRLRMLTTVSGFDDRNQINQGLLYGYLLCYEPRHFKGRLTEIPLTVQYGSKAQNVRSEEAAFLNHGTYCGDAPEVRGRTREQPAARWSADTGGRDLVLVANYSSAEHVVGIPPSTFTARRTVDHEWSQITGSEAEVILPPRSLTLLRRSEDCPDGGDI